MARSAALILAAGSGSRMGEKTLSKVLLPLFGEPVICHSVRTLSQVCDRVYLVIRPQEQSLFEKALSDSQLKADGFVSGGDSRTQSVRNGLAGLSDDVSHVLIHDGARPLCSVALAKAVLQETMEKGAAIPTVPVVDTLKTSDNTGLVSEGPDRSLLFAAQTPQGFRRDWLYAAYEKSSLSATDDAAMLEMAGHPVYNVLGETTNIKLTVPGDLAVMEGILQAGSAESSYRIGQGYDVHALVVGRPLILGGVTVPHDKGLLGHSDADVLSHAVADALLGACALGDIGQHFPDTDPAYKGADSLKLLALCMDKVKALGYRVINVDCTLMAQKPKLLPYREQMRQGLADALDVALEQVAVKATTTEKLGFIGREEGIAAQAIVLIGR